MNFENLKSSIFRGLKSTTGKGLPPELFWGPRLHFNGYHVEENLVQVTGELQLFENEKLGGPSSGEVFFKDGKPNKPEYIEYVGHRFVMTNLDRDGPLKFSVLLNPNNLKLRAVCLVFGREIGSGPPPYIWLEKFEFDPKDKIIRANQPLKSPKGKIYMRRWEFNPI